MSLKKKTVKGFSWTFIENISNKVIQFTIGIILARLLTPEEYGLIGMLAIFLAISDTFMVTGFGEALVQKKNPTKADYSTILITNILTSLFFYSLFLLFAPAISSFFKEPQLKDIIGVLGLTIVINSFVLVPRVPLVRNLKFNTLAKVSVFATVLSGGSAILLAFNGFGVWSLVWRSIIFSSTTVLILNFISRPVVSLRFNRNSFRELFGFAWQLMASRLIIELYNNLYYVIIGRFFNSRELGLYTRANGYKDLPSKTLYNVINSVSFPVLAKLQDDDQRLKRAFKRLVQITMFITFIIMFGLAGSSENFIIGLIGSKWKEAVPYLQLLCFSGVFYPLIYLNMNVWVAKGRSDLYLRMEIIMKLISIPIILVCIFLGIKAMIIGLIVIALINVVYVLRESQKLIDYSIRDQIRDIMPSFLIGVAIGAFVYLFGFLSMHPLLSLVLQGLLGFLLAIMISSFFQVKPYFEMKKIVLEAIGRN